MTTSNLRQWKTLGTITRLQGHNIFYRDSATNKAEQQRPCILLIHGFPTSSWDWAAVWPRLSADYRLLSPDLLGFGFSDKPYPYDYQINEQADLVEALMEQLELDEFHVLAHDYGDTVAQELLARQNARHQPQWLSLCLLNGGLFPEAHHALWIQRLLATPLGPLLTKHMSKQTLQRNMASIFGRQTQPDGDLVEGFWEAINHNNGRRTLAQLIDYMKQRKQHRQRWVGALQHSRVPIGLINGCADPVSGGHMLDHYKAVVGPALMTIRLDDIGHYPQWEAPEMLVSGYYQFLNAVANRPATTLGYGLESYDLGINSQG